MKTDKHILFVSQYFSPDITAAAFRISETAAILRDDGFSVEILTALAHKTKRKDNCMEDDFEILRVPISELGGQKVKDYLIHYLSFMINSFLSGAFKIHSKINYVIVTSPPLFVAFSGWLLARIKRARFILDIRDVWPDSAVDTGHLKRSSTPYRAAKFLEYFIYRRADAITCVSRKMKEYIMRRVKKDVPILVLYNGLFKKFVDDNQIRDDASNIPGNELVICYAGNIGYAQSLDLIVDAAIGLKDEKVKFLLIGEGAVKNILMNKVAAAGLKNVIFKNACSKKEAFEHMARSHALLIISNKEHTAFNLTIPSKLFDYLWANKPILYGIEDESREILNSLPGNLYFDSSDSGSLRGVISNLKADYNFYNSEANRNRDFVLKNFTREKMTRKLEEYLV